MSYFSNISSAITTLVDGMKVTMGYFVRPREHVTLQYPDEVWPVPSRNIGVGELDTYNTIRSKLTVDINDCIGCKACERACPVNCITIDTYRGEPDQDLGTTSKGTKIKLLTANFTIDMSECMFCDLCTPPCPEDCIVMTPDYQFISNDNQKMDVTPEERWRDRDLLIYQFSKVSEEERQRLKAEAKEAAQAKALATAAKKAEAEKAAAEKAAKEAAEAELQTQAPITNIEYAEEAPPVSSEPESEVVPFAFTEAVVPVLESTDNEETTRINIPIETLTKVEKQDEILEEPQTESAPHIPEAAQVSEDSVTSMEKQDEILEESQSEPTPEILEDSQDAEDSMTKESDNG